MKSTNIIPYIFAMFLPPILFVWIGQNLNERQPILCWVLCPILYAGAGLIASKGFEWSGRLKWIGTSVFIGLVEAGLLVWTA